MGKTKATWRDSGGDNHPVVHVSAIDADTFCRWASNTSGYDVSLLSVEDYEKAKASDTRPIWYAREGTTDTEDVNIVGNAWDIVGVGNQYKMIGGSYACTPNSCAGYDEKSPHYIQSITNYDTADYIGFVVQITY